MERVFLYCQTAYNVSYVLSGSYFGLFTAGVIAARTHSKQRPASRNTMLVICAFAFCRAVLFLVPQPTYNDKLYTRSQVASMLVDTLPEMLYFCAMCLLLMDNFVSLRAQAKRSGESDARARHARRISRKGSRSAAATTATPPAAAAQSQDISTPLVPLLHETSGDEDDEDGDDSASERKKKRKAHKKKGGNNVPVLHLARQPSKNPLFRAFMRMSNRTLKRVRIGLILVITMLAAIPPGVALLKSAGSASYENSFQVQVQYRFACSAVLMLLILVGSVACSSISFTTSTAAIMLLLHVLYSVYDSTVWGDLPCAAHFFLWCLYFMLSEWPMYFWVLLAIRSNFRMRISLKPAEQDKKLHALHNFQSS